jgi:hypothetical protein
VRAHLIDQQPLRARAQEADPMGSLSPHQGGSPGAFIGVVEAPDETSALKTAIEEFGIVNPKYQKPLFVRRVPGDDD